MLRKKDNEDQKYFRPTVRKLPACTCFISVFAINIGVIKQVVTVLLSTQGYNKH